MIRPSDRSPQFIPPWRECICHRGHNDRDPPHQILIAVKRAREPLLHNAIGREVRAFRTRHGMKVSDLAAATDLSVGMLSKIENGGISPSLTTLQAISRGLAVPITWLVSRFEAERMAVFIKAANDKSAVSRVGPQRILLSDTEANAKGLRVESYMISLTCETDVFPAVGHEGMVFLYLLQGEIVYRHGASVYRLTPGDSLFFDAATQHNVDELAQLPVRCLSIATRRQDR